MSENTIYEKKQKLTSQFFKKGIMLATVSGICYGLYTTFLTLAMSTGVWYDWYGINAAGLTILTVTYVIGALGSAINDFLSALWASGMAGIKGKLADFKNSLKSKAGKTLVVASLIGGPVATTAYVVAIQMAGSIVVPIAALCPAIGAILSRILYKQKLSARVVFGICVCLAAGVIIGLQGFDTYAPEGMVLGIVIALIAAVGWGLEGAVGGYSTAIIDYEIGILIRQTVSSLAGFVIVIPILAIISSDIGLLGSITIQAVTDPQAMPLFIISGFFALFAFSLWYKGNSMCGTALGMAANGAFSFWGPFFMWLILGVILGQDGWNLAPMVWFAAVLMFVGILIIAVNPLTLLKRRS